MRASGLSISLIGILLLLFACTPHPKTDSEEVRIGTITGPETDLMAIAQKIGERYHLKITIVPFEDYILPNVALAEGAIDANLFQHYPYFQAALAKKHYAFTALGNTFIYPIGLYSSKYQTLQALPQGALIGIPNDPSNGARALRLLAQEGLITLPPLDDLALSPQKITENPHAFRFKEIPAAQLPRLLPDLDAAVINTNYALSAGLLPEKKALLQEAPTAPYANILVVRTQEKDLPKFQKLLEVLHSPEMLQATKERFSDGAIPAW